MNVPALRETLTAAPYSEGTIMVDNLTWPNLGAFFSALEEGAVQSVLLGAELIAVVAEPLLDVVELVGIQATELGALLTGQRMDQQVIGFVDPSDGSWLPVPR